MKAELIKTECRISDFGKAYTTYHIKTGERVMRINSDESSKITQEQVLELAECAYERDKRREAA